MKLKTSDLINLFLLTVGVWYFTTRMDVGREFIGDVKAIPQQLGVAEGLKSATQYMK